MVQIAQRISLQKFDMYTTQNIPNFTEADGMKMGDSKQRKRNEIPRQRLKVKIQICPWCCKKTAAHNKWITSTLFFTS